VRKVILSRKGYDDQYGGRPSVIMPDGAMLSFPIPILNPNEEGIKTENLTFRGQNLSQILTQLDPRHCNKKHHVDPDLYGLAGQSCLGTFGQNGGALGHLNNREVGVGDVFLFFGTFCPVTETANGLKYEKMHPFHAIYGFLEVNSQITMDDIDNNPELFSLRDHPHYINRYLGDYKNSNCLYIGKNFGYFRFAENLRLTKPGYKKTVWRLPEAFANVKISYHDNVEKILRDGFVEFQSVSKGQEFVIEANPELEGWLEEVIKNKV